MLNESVLSSEVPQPKLLWFFMVSFAMIISISNWYDARLVTILGFVISPGTLSYPLSFLISDSITEVYGYKRARLAIWTALLFNLIFILFGQMVTHMPSPAFANENKAFDQLLSMNALIVFASFTSYLIAEPVNSYLIAKMKIIFKGKYIGIRFVLATVIAAFLDTVLFITLAFHGMMDNSSLIQMIINVWLIKVMIEIIFLPFSIRLSKWLKKKEEMDIYDYQTRFNIFSLDAEYKNENNLYLKKED